jgi:hypothetical protein
MSRTQLEAVRRMLRELSEMCENASLTGALAGGAAHATTRYNRMLETLEDEDVVPHGMFSKLDEQSTGFGQLAVDCRLLLASIRDDGDGDEGRRSGKRGGRGLGALIALAPFLDKDDLENLVRERVSEAGPINDGILIGLAPFLNKGMLREIVNKRVGMAGGPAAPEPPSPPEPPKPPTPPEPTAGTPAWAGVGNVDLNFDQDFGSRPPAQDELSTLAARLAQPYLSDSERAQIAAKLAELAREQGV